MNNYSILTKEEYDIIMDRFGEILTNFGVNYSYDPEKTYSDYDSNTDDFIDLPYPCAVLTGHYLNEVKKYFWNPKYPDEYLIIPMDPKPYLLMSPTFCGYIIHTKEGLVTILSIIERYCDELKGYRVEDEKFYKYQETLIELLNKELRENKKR